MKLIFLFLFFSYTFSFDNVLIRKNLDIKSGRLEGIILEKEEKKAILSFIFSEEPELGLSYFVEYDSSEEVLFIDFYNTELGESSLDTIYEPPILMSMVKTFEVDLNKDIEEFEPDVRNVVRVIFYPQRQFNYEMNVNNFGILEMEYPLLRKKIKKKRSYLWDNVFYFSLLSGAASFCLFQFLNPQK